MASPVDRFELTEEHVKLLRHASVSWDSAEWGAPEIDPKRPFGNGDVCSDMHEILTGEEWPPDSRAEETTLEASYRTLYRELERALQVVLAAGSFEPGFYESPEYHDKWVRVAA